MTNTQSAQWIANALSLAAASCEQIKDLSACSACPFYSDCLEHCSVIDAADMFNTSEWNDFISLADDVLDWCDHIDYEADYADRARKTEIEERMIDEIHGR